MKKLNEWLMMSLLALLLGTSACSAGGDEEEAPAVPTFPTSQTFNVSANSEQIFSFAANMDWKLSSNKTWCTLASSAMEGQNISGQAGNQSVKIKISDEGQDFTETKAAITLSMGGKNQTVAEVIRTAKAYELKVYDAEGKEVNQLAIGTDGSLYLKVEANFEFAATAFPEWLNVEMAQDATNVGIQTGTISVVGDAIKYKQETSSTNKITFANQAGTAKFEFPVTYAGMDPNIISFIPGSQWGVSVAKDGKTYKTQSLDGSTPEDVAVPYSVTITALNDEYVFEYYKYDSKYGWTRYQTEYAGVEQPWFTISEDNKKGNIKVSFAANTEAERTGYLLAFPKAIYESISSDIDGKILDQSTDCWELKIEYEKYVIAEFVQESGAETLENTGFTVVNSLKFEEIKNTKVTDPEIIDVVRGNCLYYGNEIYSINVNPGTPILIFPNLPETSWTCDMPPMIEGDKNPIVEGYIGESMYIGHALQYIVPQEPEGNIFIVFKNSETWEMFKVLVIIPNK